MQDRGIKELIASVCYPVLHCVVNRAIIKGCNPLHLFRLSMLDRPLILWMKLSVVTQLRIVVIQFTHKVASLLQL